jgi:hypothetical protein
MPVKRQAETLNHKVDGCSANSYIATHIPSRISHSQ